MYLIDDPIIRKNCVDVSQHDLFSDFDINIDDIKFPVFPSGFQGLVRILISQQISFRVAETLWERLIKHVDGLENLSPEWISQQNAEDLKPFGFTKQKTQYAKRLSEQLLEQEFHFRFLDKLDDESVKSTIMSFYGFGEWSAYMYLMLCLGRRNILPAKDLAVNQTAKKIFELDYIPPYEELLVLTNDFEGKRTALTLIIWQIYINKL